MMQQQQARNQSAATVTALQRKYQADQLRLLTSDYSAAEALELTLRRGTVVALLKDKDPLGSHARCYVDDGGKQHKIR